MVDQLNQLNRNDYKRSLSHRSTSTRRNIGRMQSHRIICRLQRLGDFRAYNEQARFLTMSSFTAAKLSFAMMSHCIAILHTVVLRVHTDYRLDHIVRCSQLTDDGPGSARNAISGKPLKVRYLESTAQDTP